jgi:hypothetical protein
LLRSRAAEQADRELLPKTIHKPAGGCLASGDHTQDGGDGGDETAEFKLDAAAVVAEEAVERKEVRHAKPWLSECRVSSELGAGRAGARSGRGGRGGAEEHQGTNTASSHWRCRTEGGPSKKGASPCFQIIRRVAIHA